MRFILVFTLTFFGHLTGSAQTETVFSLEEFIGMVKKNHPVVAQANLIISEGEAQLLRARGSFDPNLEIDYAQKQFEDTEYYDNLNAVFKIPTWYGVSLKSNYELNSGNYVNPQNLTPEEGLLGIGISASLAKDLLINKRMATLKQAKLFKEQSVIDSQIAINNIIFEAVNTYFNWLKNYKTKQLLASYVTNSEIRFKNIKTAHFAGELPAIDTTEAKIIFNNRKLMYEKAELDYLKTTLELSNYLWLNNLPLEINSKAQPDLETENSIDELLQINRDFDPSLSWHPKLQSLDLKRNYLDLERKLMQNNLLPQINLDYQFLNNSTAPISQLNTSNIKSSLKVKFPIFLRKERAEVKLSKFKLQDIDYEKKLQTLSINNKITASKNTINSYYNQRKIAQNIISDYKVLLGGEERKFEVGESSLFIINSREAKLIESQVKDIVLENKLLGAKSELYKIRSLTF